MKLTKPKSSHNGNSTESSSPPRPSCPEPTNRRMRHNRYFWGRCVGLASSKATSGIHEAACAQRWRGAWAKRRCKARATVSRSAHDAVLELVMENTRDCKGKQANRHKRAHSPGCRGGRGGNLTQPLSLASPPKKGAVEYWAEQKEGTLLIRTRLIIEDSKEKLCTRAFRSPPNHIQ